MTRQQLSDDVAMLPSVSMDWHHDIFLPADAQIMSISLSVYSPVYPDYLYTISWSPIVVNGIKLQVPIDAAKINYSTLDEAVRLAFDIIYYTDKAK